MQNRNKLEINGVDRGSKTRYGESLKSVISLTGTTFAT
jgi:hypothetical protein